MDERIKNDIEAKFHNGHSKLPRVAQTVKVADDKVVAFVRERPVVAVCAAVAVGYLLGRLFTRID
jgi:ElaB/YqjD/DUF883 family membrane-anchored ribosome-binding protein